MSETLDNLIAEAFGKFGDRIALEDPAGRTATYRDLELLSGRLSQELGKRGLCRGDRVGILAEKSIETVASIFGVLRAGAAYVPVNPSAPTARIAGILEDCDVAAVIVQTKLLDEFQKNAGGGSFCEPISVGEMSVLLKYKTGESDRKAQSSRDPLKSTAYILYTSGSTGKPKGVVHTHSSAMSFVSWCAGTFGPQKDERFASHAPFYFDLSILDLYLPLTCGATLVLVDDAMGKNPMQLAQFIAEKKITSWYSTPSILTMMAKFGHMERHDYKSLRRALFAGEVFPVKHLRLLNEFWPRPIKYNLFGPTETNVCTFHKIPNEIPKERKDPFPIGKCCDNDRVRVVDANGGEVSAGEAGELLISGGTVMEGYFNAPEQNSKCFVEDEDGVKWYKTGDMVKELEDGDFLFLGRRDRMIKRRGYRIELGEIEAAMLTHGKIEEAAVVTKPDEESGVVIEAFMSTATGEKLSTIELKMFLAKALPNYMVPDRFRFLSSLPRTPTNKTDYQALKEMS